MMNILILKTNIAGPSGIQAVQAVLNRHPVISRWTIDTEDIDNVLRIEASDTLTEADVIELVGPVGFKCEELQD
ncbi:MAG: hypothetical protein RLP14_09570 [Owenweeksia sp.]